MESLPAVDVDVGTGNMMVLVWSMMKSRCAYALSERSLGDRSSWGRLMLFEPTADSHRVLMLAVLNDYRLVCVIARSGLVAMLECCQSVGGTMSVLST